MVFQRVTEACQIAESLHKTDGTTRPPAEVESLICAALRPLRFNNGRSYYFIVRMDGQCLLLDPWKELEGKDLLTYPASASAVSNMIQIAREQGAGFTEYEWARPGDTAYGHRKIAYVKYFAPLNCLIGTGEYVSDWVADTRKALLERIRTISYRRNGYIFVATDQLATTLQTLLKKRTS